MQVIPIKTPIITAGLAPVAEIIDQVVDHLEEGDILAISSKVVALCENNVRPLEAGRDELITEQSDYFLPTENSKYGHHFTITNNTLVGSAGIDASNGDNHFVLWPKDPQTSVNAIRRHLRQRFGLKEFGVIITDSASQPLRLGSVGVTIAHSGFLTIHDYRGQADLFNRPMLVARSNIASGLAAAANLVMGEGAEQIPISILRDVPFVTFQDQDPTPEELNEIHLSMEDDLFAPFLQNAPWKQGNRNRDNS